MSASPRLTRPVDARPARPRVWLAAAATVLLVLTYLSVQLSYARAHLPPDRYRVLPAGQPATSSWADFRLVSLERTGHWGQEGGEPGVPAADTEWVVARLEVTPRHLQEYMLCTFTLVATDGRSWEYVGIGPSHEGEPCVPTGDDDPPVEIGRVYPVVQAFQVPVSDLDDLAGLALDPYSARRYQLIRPAI